MDQVLSRIFGFSFVQSDIAEGIVAWVEHDMNERHTAVVMERDENDKLIGTIHPHLFMYEQMMLFADNYYFLQFITIF